MVQSTEVVEAGEPDVPPNEVAEFRRRPTFQNWKPELVLRRPQAAAETLIRAEAANCSRPAQGGQFKDRGRCGGQAALKSSFQFDRTGDREMVTRSEPELSERGFGATEAEAKTNRWLEVEARRMVGELLPPLMCRANVDSVQVDDKLGSRLSLGFGGRQADRFVPAFSKNAELVGIEIAK